MKRILKRIFKIFSWIFLFIIVILLVINTPIILFSKDTLESDYKNWMSDNISNDRKVIDIAMLGAHDTFSDQITIFSKADKLSASSVMMGVPGVLIKGFSVKQSKTQISDITTLLDKGVRYLDVRVSYKSNDDSWYTVHNFYSDDFKASMEKVSDFLKTNKGEFVILDLQHIYGIDYDSQTDFDKVYNILSDSGIIDYAYKSNIKALKDVTYGDVTSDGVESGVIILSKFKHNNEYIWNYESSIRSAWADSDDFNKTLEFLNNEKALIESGTALTGNQVENPTNQIDCRDAFRVMQGVITMQMSVNGIFKGITSWSLVERAKKFNVYLIDQDIFVSLIASMPIVMVDYADSNYHGFLQNVMTIIINYDTDVSY